MDVMFFLDLSLLQIYTAKDVNLLTSSQLDSLQFNCKSKQVI